MTNDGAGWFSHSPVADSSRHDQLTAEQHATLDRRVSYPESARDQIAEVHVFFSSLEPGQVEIQFRGPPEVARSDILRAAIRELETAVAIYTDVS
jgi:hypothetical protein